MAHFENDELLKLSETNAQPYDESFDSIFKRPVTRSQSAPTISIPISFMDSYERETSLVGHTDQLNATPVTGNLLQQQGNNAEGRRIENFATFCSTDSSHWNDKCDRKNENLLRSGQLGRCVDPYGTTCPIHFNASQQKNPKPSTIFDPKFHRALYGVAKDFVRKLFSFCSSFVTGVKNPRDKAVLYLNTIFAVFGFISIFVDPLFSFLIHVQQDYKCIAINLNLTTALVLLRSISDVVYFMKIVLQFRLAYVSPESTVVGAGDLIDQSMKIALHYLKGYFFIDLFVALPLPQIMILLVWPNSLRGANYAKGVLRAAILVQYILKLFRILPLLTGQSPIGFISESAWAHFIINLLIFMLASHVVGSCWYLFGLQRINLCLREACQKSNITGCMNFIDCGLGRNGNQLDLTSNKWNNNTDAINCLYPPSEGGFSFGIFKGVVPLTMETHVANKYVYSFFWGLQQISTLAGNQVPSYFLGEVFFTIFIIGSGLLLFAILIEDIQNFLQALGRRSLEMQLRRRDVEQWMSHRRLPKGLRRSVRQVEQYNWVATRGVNEEMLMENIPEDLQRDIRRHLFKFVKKMDEPILDAICERLRQKTYIKGSRILSQGGLVEKMVFVVRGKLESIGEDGARALLSEGDACGEELLTWHRDHSFVSKDGKNLRLPGQRLVSTRTVKCLTNVELFSLSAAALEEVTMFFTSFLRSSRVQGALRYESPYWRSLAATRIQIDWIRYRNKCLRRVNSLLLN